MKTKRDEQTEGKDRPEMPPTRCPAQSSNSGIERLRFTYASIVGNLAIFGRHEFAGRKNARNGSPIVRDGIQQVVAVLFEVSKSEVGV